MSIKATRKELKENYACIGCGYDTALHLLNYECPTFYNYGKAGWNFDGYILRHSKTGQEVLLTTGYRNMIHNGIVKDDYKIIAKYEKQAHELFKDYQVPDRKTMQQIKDKLIEEIFEEIYKYYYGD